MKRKVNKVGQNTLTVSLPANWAKKKNIKAGDELEVIEEDDNKIIFYSSAAQLQTGLRTSFDITNLDSSTILHIIQAAYRIGFDEVYLEFSNERTQNTTKQKQERIISVVQRTINRLIGFEIIDIQPNSCTIKTISQNDSSEFKSISKKTIYLYKELTKDIINSLLNNNQSLMQSIQEQHDNLTKFVSFCLRVMSKSNEFEGIKTQTYHIYSNLDKIADIYKYIARDFSEQNLKLSKEEVRIIKKIGKNLLEFGDLLISYDKELMSKISVRRGELLSDTLKYQKKHMCNEVMCIILRLEQGLELIHDLAESRTGLELRARQ